MILNRPLTADERKRSQRLFDIFSLINGASYMCLGENLLILFAVHLSAPNWVVALLGSMMMLGYFVMPLGILRTAKVGAAACQSDFWIGRNIAALSIALSVIVADRCPELSWAIVLIGAFLFYGFRAAGCVLAVPLIGDIATPDEAPILISRNNGRFYLSGVLMTFAISALLFFSESVAMLVGVMIFGATLGITASTFIRRMHESGAVRDAAKQKLIPGIREAFGIADVRRLAAGWFCLNIITVLSAPISVLAFKRGLGLNDTEALICSAVQFGACFVFAPVSGRLCCAFGPKFLLKHGSALFLVVALLWIVFPPLADIPHLLLILAGTFFSLLIGVGYIFTMNAVSSYFLMVCPDKRLQVPGSISIQLAVSVGAGIVASLLSTSLVKFSEFSAQRIGGYFAADALGGFKLYFIVFIPVFLVCHFFIRRMRVVVYEYRAKYGHDAVVRLVRMAHCYRRLIRHH